MCQVPLPWRTSVVIFEPSERQNINKTNTRGIGDRVADGVCIIKEDLCAEVPFKLNSQDWELASWAEVACPANVGGSFQKGRTMSPERAWNEYSVPEDTLDLEGWMVWGVGSEVLCWLQLQGLLFIGYTAQDKLTFFLGSASSSVKR